MVSCGYRRTSAQVTQPKQSYDRTNQIIAIFFTMLIPALARTTLDGNRQSKFHFIGTQIVAVCLGTNLCFRGLAVTREGYPRDGVPEMATQCAQFEPVAWWWTRNKIGQDLKKFYEVPKELPAKLLPLVRKLDAIKSNQSPRSQTLISKLDAIEGNYLSHYAPPVEPRSVGSSVDWSLCT
jgi:hypothetical protein